MFKMNCEPCYRLDPKFSPSMSCLSSSFYSKLPSKKVALCGQKLIPMTSLDFIETNNELLENLVSHSMEIYKQNFNYDSDLLKDKKLSELNELENDTEGASRPDIYSSSVNFDYNLYSNKPITLRDIHKNQFGRSHSAISSRYTDSTKIIYNLSKLRASNRKNSFMPRSEKQSRTSYVNDLEEDTNSQFF